MKTLIELIRDHQNGSEEACAEIMERMTPLAKKYAAKIHCLEYDDALQELYLALLESLRYLDGSAPEGKCVKYMEAAVIHRYYALCKYYLSMPDTETIENNDPSLPASPVYDDSALDIEAYIHTLPESGYKREIFSLYFYLDWSDKEIANHLGISRQYVNRIKKSLIKTYFT